MFNDGEMDLLDVCRSGLIVFPVCGITIQRCLILFLNPVVSKITVVMAQSFAGLLPLGSPGCCHLELHIFRQGPTCSIRINKDLLLDHIQFIYVLAEEER